jgi:hypothetical protein
MSDIGTAVCCIVCFAMGYTLGRIEFIISMLRGRPSDAAVGVPSFFDSQKTTSKEKKPIVIDERKFVTNVSTEELSSTSEQSLGTVTKTDDNVSSAASKLAQLKKMKG